MSGTSPPIDHAERNANCAVASSTYSGVATSATAMAIQKADETARDRTRSGRETTILQAGPGMPNETRIISANSADGTGRVTGALFKNFTVDGAADQQPDAQSMVGISNVWTDRISLLGVRVSRVKGTGAAEGVCFDSYYSTNHAYRDCEAQQIPTMATGSIPTAPPAIASSGSRRSSQRTPSAAAAMLSPPPSAHTARPAVTSRATAATASTSINRKMSSCSAAPRAAT